MLAGPEELLSWILLAILVLFTHPIIDVFTSYGTQLLAPFSRHRFAIDALPIIDPVYSLALIAALVVGTFARRSPGIAVGSAAAALPMCWLLWWVRKKTPAYGLRGQKTLAMRHSQMVFSPQPATGNS